MISLFIGAMTRNHQGGVKLAVSFPNENLITITTIIIRIKSQLILD